MASDNVGVLSFDIRAGFAKLEHDLKEGAHKFAEFGEEIKGALEFGKKVLEFELLREAAEKLFEVLEQAHQVEAVSEAFKTLQGEAGESALSLQQLRAATGGLIDDMTLMRAANESALSGLDPQRFAVVAEAAHGLGEAVGIDAKEALDKLTRALDTGQIKQAKLLLGTVNMKKAEQELAKEIGTTSERLSEEGKLEAHRRAILDAVIEKSEKLGESGDTLGKAFDRVETSSKNAWIQFLEGINKSTDLRDALNDLNTDIVDNTPNLVKLGKAIGDINALFINGAAAAKGWLAGASEWIDKHATMGGLHSASAPSIPVDDNGNPVGPGGLDAVGIRQLKQQIGEDLVNAAGAAAGAIDVLGAKIEHTSVKTKASAEDARKWTDQEKLQADAAKAAAKAAAEAEKAFAKMNEELADAKADAAIDTLKTKVDDLVEGVGKLPGLGSAADLSGVFQEIGDQISDKLYAKNEENLEKLAAAGKIIEYNAAVDTIDKTAAYRLEVYENEVAKKQKEIDEKNYEQSVQFFQGLLEDAISGTRFSFVDQFKKAAAEIGAEFLAQLVKANLLGSKSFGDLFGKVTDALGSAFGNWFSKSGVGQAFGSSFSGILGSITGSGGAFDFGGAIKESTSVFNEGMAEANAALDDLGATLSTTTDASAATTSAFGSVTAAALPLAAALAAVAAIGLNISNIIKGKNVGAGAAGLAVDTIFPGVGSAAADAFGFFNKGKSLSPNQEAIKKLESTIEDALKKAFGKAFDFVVGDIDKFDKADWADKFWEKFKDKGGDAFNALGHSLPQILGVEGGAGEQFASLFADNLAGSDLESSLDNISLLLDSMGISVEQLQEKLLDTAKAGEITWQQFDVMNQSLNQIPKSGLVGLGDVKGAFEELITSGGRGVKAIKGIKDIAIEAGEKGIKSFAQLRDALLAAGYDAQTVSAFFTALGQRGITSIQQLSTLGDAQLGGIVAQMQNLGVDFEALGQNKGADEASNKFQNLADQIRNANKALNDLPRHINIDITTSGEQNVGAAAKGAVLGYARGGVFNKPTTFNMPGGHLGMLGEAGPEAILPLARINGKLGVVSKTSGGSQPIVINLDARNADAGVENRLMPVITAWGQQLRSELINALGQRERREVY